MLDLLRLSPLAPWHYLTYSEPFYFDTSKLEGLGWRSKYSNQMMLREAFDDFISVDLDASEFNSPHRSKIGEKALKIVKRLS